MSSKESRKDCRSCLHRRTEGVVLLCNLYYHLDTEKPLLTSAARNNPLACGETAKDFVPTQATDEQISTMFD